MLQNPSPFTTTPPHPSSLLKPSTSSPTSFAYFEPRTTLPLSCIGDKPGAMLLLSSKKNGMVSPTTGSNQQWTQLMEDGVVAGGDSIGSASGEGYGSHIGRRRKGTRVLDEEEEASLRRRQHEKRMSLEAYLAARW
ncbi:uncharacterized protein HKW66_Vig0184830 [Vigna angularis]|uniref:Uncharacterized protein n=1 Tax=Phaseolus angularis TaxID=3914 RepID=A0A8T0KTA5_PHAAN|nr:uncharacterized protein HKW66_Vig0184830 [Vigna angularis]